MSDAIQGNFGGSTISNFCARYDISRSTFYAEVQRKRLVARKIGNRTIVLNDDEAAWRDSLRRVDSTSAA